MNRTLAATLAAVFLSACSQSPSPSAQATSEATALPAAAPPAAEIPVAKPAQDPNLPESARGENWEYVVNNAYRAADEYATARNPNAVFLKTCGTESLNKQFGGAHKGRFLLNITCEHGGNTSFAVLLPLFDEYAPSDKLDDSGKLWNVVMAKYNGKSF